MCHWFIISLTRSYNIEGLIIYANIPYPKFTLSTPNHTQYYQLFNVDFYNMVHISKFGVGLMVCIMSHARHLQRLNQIYGKGDIGLLLMVRLIHVVASNSDLPTARVIWYHGICTRLCRSHWMASTWSMSWLPFRSTPVSYAMSGLMLIRPNK